MCKGNSPAPSISGSMPSFSNALASASIFSLFPTEYTKLFFSAKSQSKPLQSVKYFLTASWFASRYCLALSSPAVFISFWYISPCCAVIFAVVLPVVCEHMVSFSARIYLIPRSFKKCAHSIPAIPPPTISTSVFTFPLSSSKCGSFTVSFQIDSGSIFFPPSIMMV